MVQVVFKKLCWYLRVQDIGRPNASALHVSPHIPCSEFFWSACLLRLSGLSSGLYFNIMNILHEAFKARCVHKSLRSRHAERHPVQPA